MGGGTWVGVGGSAEGWWSCLVDYTRPTGGAEILLIGSDNDIQPYGDGHGSKGVPWPSGAQETGQHPWQCRPVERECHPQV